MKPSYLNRSIPVARTQGATLLEMLLVLVIVAMLITLSMSYLQQRAQQAMINKAARDVQGILNAAMAYRTDTGVWPANVTCLLGTGGAPCVGTGPYLGSVPAASPWSTSYVLVPPASLASAGPYRVYFNLTASTQTRAVILASIVSNLLPASVVNGSTNTSPAVACTAATCYVHSQVNAMPMTNTSTDPGYVRFAGLYHHGACVPVPTCPTTNPLPQIFVVPAQVYGTVNNGNTTYPLQAFTAYARGGVGSGVNPAGCLNSTGAPVCADASGTNAANYWRVCMGYMTSHTLNGYRGRPDPTTPLWGSKQVLMAIVRCAPNPETPVGSSFSVYSN